MSESLKQTVRKNVFFLYLFSFLVIPVSFAIRIVLARNLSGADFGLVYSLLSFFGLISIFNDFGLTETLNYHGVRFYEKKRLGRLKGAVRIAFLSQTITAVAIGLVLFFFAPWLAENYFHYPMAGAALQAGLLYFLFFNMSRAFVTAVNVTQNVFYNKMFEVFNLAVVAAGVVALWLTGRLSAEGTMLFWGMGIFIVFILSFFVSRSKIREISRVKAEADFGLFKKLLKYSLFVALGTGAMYVLSYSDLQVITYFSTLENAGLYSAASSISKVLAGLALPIAALLFPLGSKLFSEGRKKEIKAILELTYSLGFFVAVPFFLLASVFSKEVLLVIFGQGFVASQGALLVLLAAKVFYVFFSINFAFSAAFGRVKERTKYLYFAALLNIVLSILLVRVLGIVGVAVGTLVTTLFLFGSTYFIVNKEVPFSIDFFYILKTVFLSLGVLVLAFGVKAVMPGHYVVKAVVIGGLACAVYLLGGIKLKLVDVKKILAMVRER
jgi:stage V sporulation protein B